MRQRLLLKPPLWVELGGVWASHAFIQIDAIMDGYLDDLSSLHMDVVEPSGGDRKVKRNDVIFNCLGHACMSEVGRAKEEERQRCGTHHATNFMKHGLCAQCLMNDGCHLASLGWKAVREQWE